ncbi:hypothetical protein BDP81DRAFT_509692 [Colletotrichum phormii]|uniref:Uncharacterized protein n=1 Tax=Colletotrichum phormii TaxID=359342 RepID=A0AAI9ZYH7_9PEZI|nr:uncharacterized protein BDP81DRAFT_509692 [Colletotrichum phormii]KAK1640579.1 hypothetical protein BDP81DRAFT_509692 [Colletotrichum phormii]
MLILPTITLCALATAPLTAAAPTDVGSSSPPRSLAPFTFEQWADDIITNPTAQHLSAKEAAEASVRARNIIGWQPSVPHNASGSGDFDGNQLNKRDKVFLKSKSSDSGKVIDINTVRCNSFPTDMAPMEDAAWCIQWLANQAENRFLPLKWQDFHSRMEEKQAISAPVNLDSPEPQSGNCKNRGKDHGLLHQQRIRTRRNDCVE